MAKKFTPGEIAHTVLMLRERPDRMDAFTRNKAADIIESLQERLTTASTHMDAHGCGCPELDSEVG